MRENLVKDIEESLPLRRLLQSVQNIDFNQADGKIADIGYPKGVGLDSHSEMCFFHVTTLSYDEKYPRREAFENVLNSLDNDAFNFVYVLSGDEHGVELDIGVVKNSNVNKKTLSTVNYGEIIEKSFEGNFSGSSLRKMDSEELACKILRPRHSFKSAGIISGIPSINEKEDGGEDDFQGIDRLINSMLGQNWRIIVVCEPVCRDEILRIKQDVYDLYNRLSLYSKVSIQNTENSGEGISFGRSSSHSENHSHNWNESDTESDGTGDHSTSNQKGKGGSSGSDDNNGKNWGYNENKGSSHAVSLEIENKHARDLMKYIDEELLPRIKQGYGKQFFKTSLYYMSDKIPTANRLKSSIMSLFQGNKSSFSPLNDYELDLKNSLCVKSLSSYQNAFYNLNDYSLDAATLLGKPSNYRFGLGISAYLTSSEVSIFAGLPQKEVPGIALNESVEYGLNEKSVSADDSVDLGFLVQQERILPIRYVLSKKSLMKHTFVAGVTGSGKTTTCHKLLASVDVPFLIIEPAKTEYRTLALNKKFGKVYVFTLGNESVAPFRLNPFELVEREIISAHIDMLKATFTSAFPMEASMPQILEEAMIRCYEKKGWSLDTNDNSVYDDPFGKDREQCFPIMSELLEQMKLIVEEKGFSPQMRADYEGSLVSRLSNLTVGAKGRMLNCSSSIDFKFLASKKVVIEMEELRSPEDKALMMGFILSRLSAVIKSLHRKKPEYRHSTLIEEAHRLLAKTDYSDNGSKKAAVETFADLLAEVRKYGEGLIVVDQIPNKLATEVLKNTNTKIVHKILAKDDKESVGDTMLMDDKQKSHLSALEPGHAVVFSENTSKPIHVYIDRETNTNEAEITDETIKKLFDENRQDFGIVYDDLEVLPYFQKYIEMSRPLRERCISQEIFLDMKKMVNHISKKTGLSPKNVWKKFCARQERITGNEISSDFIEQMGEFLDGIFSKNSISEIDLDRKMCNYFILT